MNYSAIDGALDMFRYSKNRTDSVPGTDPVFDLSAVAESYFSVDGGKTR